MASERGKTLWLRHYLSKILNMEQLLIATLIATAIIGCGNKGENPANTETGGSKPERLVKVSDTGQVVYQAEKQACRVFPDLKGDGT